LENLNETIQFLIQSLQTYTGNNPIWILYPVALILIWFLGKKGDRKLFIGVFVTECLTIFNPFVVKVLLDVFGFGTRFVRFLWIIVFFITIGYALTLLIFASAKTGVRILTGGICLVLIVTLGIPVFRGAEDFPYKKATNAYFVGQEILDLSSIIHSEGIEQPRILSDGLLLVYRQYDPDVRSYVSRRILQKIEKTSEEKFMKKKKIKDWMKKIVAVYYYHDYSLPAEEFQSLVRGSKVDYIISATPELDEYLSGTTMYVLGQTENYRVWKVV
jgi:hypothetical protein